MINHTNDEHMISIIKQKEISCDLLKKLISSSQHSINELYARTVIEQHSKLFSQLRSKIFPDNLIKKFTEDFFYTFIDKNKEINLYCVLAGTTALNELQYFVRFIEIFNLFEATLFSLHFLLVDWPDLNNISTRSNSNFLNIVNQIDTELDEKTDRYHLHVVSCLADRQLETPYLDLTFNEQFQHIMQLIERCDNILYRQKTDLDVDIKWITNFYDRQKSLHPLGHKQAILDLAIRRGIGAYITTKAEVLNRINKSCFLITSELNKRFLKCYAAKVPIINITVNK